MPIIIFIPILTSILCSYMYFEDKYNIKHFHIFSFICLIFFSFIVGVRENLGTDHLTYLTMYANQQGLLRLEPIFAYINTFLYSYRAPYQYLFIIVAFLEFFFLSQTIKRNKISWVYTTLLFIILYFSWFVCFLRQAIAMTISLFVLKDFYKKKYVRWLFMMIIACGFHKSAIIMIFFCPFCKALSKFTIKKTSVNIFILPFIFILVLQNQTWDLLLYFLNIIGNLLPKEFSFLIKAFSSYRVILNTGLVVKSQMLGYICMLPKLINIAKKDKYTSFLFFLFYFGLIGFFFCITNLNLARIFLYMVITELILSPKAITTIKKRNILNLQNILFISGLLISFILPLMKFLIGPDPLSNTLYTWDLDFSFKKHFGR